MMTAVETLTPTETAVVASVSLRDVNRVIDEKILPETFYVDRDRTRRFFVDSCALIAFYFKAADRLTAEERSRTIANAMPLRESTRWHELWTDLKTMDWKEWTIQEDFLTVDLAPFLQPACERLARLMAARERVTKDPDILRGTPVIKGTRIPVYDVAASVAAGISPQRLLEAYPGLSIEDFELAALYAEANPPRGRPRRLPEPPVGSVIVSSHRAPRRQRS